MFTFSVFVVTFFTFILLVFVLLIFLPFLPSLHFVLFPVSLITFLHCNLHVYPPFLHLYILHVAFSFFILPDLNFLYVCYLLFCFQKFVFYSALHSFTFLQFQTCFTSFFLFTFFTFSPFTFLYVVVTFHRF